MNLHDIKRGDLIRYASEQGEHVGKVAAVDAERVTVRLDGHEVAISRQSVVAIVRRALVDRTAEALGSGFQII